MNKLKLTMITRPLTVLVLALGLFMAPGALLAQVSVVTTTTDLASIAKQIGGEHVRVESLGRTMQDPHYLDATPGMIVRTSNADVVVFNGMELEIGWLPEVFRQTRNRDVRPGGPGHVDASRGVEAIQIPDEVDRAKGDIHPDGNPHYTLEPVQSQHAARNIAEALSQVDSNNAEHYQTRLEEYIEETDRVVSEYRERFEDHAGSGVIIYHKFFDYMLKQLGLEIVDAVEPLPGVNPSASHIAGLIDAYEDDERVKMVVMEPWHNERLARQVAEGIGIPLVELCPAVGCEETGTIVELFKHNADKLLNVLEDG